MTDAPEPLPTTDTSASPEPSLLRTRILATGVLAVLVAVGVIAVTQNSARDTPPGVVASPTPSAERPADGEPDPAEPSGEPSPDPAGTADPADPADPTLDPAPLVPRVTVATQTVVAEGLSVPWALAELPDGDLLVTLRDEARILRVSTSTGGEPRPLRGPGAEQLLADTVPGGEGGLLGIAVVPPDPEGDDGDEGASADEVTVVVYRTGAEDNAVLRATLTGDELGTWEPILTGIPKAGVHNGGALGIGPDGFLYVATGDAGDPTLSQDVESLGGKILRVDLTGQAPAGNPLPGSPMWSLGHRNVQGIDWDPRGRMFATEFGQNAIDELNLIVAGENYGWPRVEGPGGSADGFVDPVAAWRPEEASPSGLAVTNEGIYLAGLRGERLWRVPLGAVVRPEALAPQALLEGEHGRLRGLLTSGEAVLVTTSNTDGRGDPDDADDQILRLTFAPEETG